MILTKETNKAPVTDPKEMKIYILPDKESKIIILKKLNKMQENTDRQINKIKQLWEQNEKFNKEIGTLKKNQTEVLEPQSNNTLSMRQSLEL